MRQHTKRRFWEEVQHKQNPSSLEGLEVNMNMCSYGCEQSWPPRHTLRTSSSTTDMQTPIAALELQVAVLR
jgi:hypothetical protein